ncbi:CpsB/CapC family capsule biosynthesis tyrosine phosphatase [Anaerosacchariphilus polymeriproducens]|uniref:protein-tyrosine-phosphatase n=1 Tax=Anaerosacchariphilus polymeriproducens TaxID=1812858 RepID=A0A371AQY4_9FIRM|nr:CpsB/CapC family capsule biosynthesis tyrosine phosphatase [Anaerosacchariphilus polymeriproducens]RDU21986.1 hypothetical protein DWV06_15750 [Anaerosacchariphilus polymeriproducens]
MVEQKGVIINKKKKYENKFIDIHNHLLPWLDDGSKSLEQTENMLKIAYKEGVRTIIVTPHFKGENDYNFYNHVEDVLETVKSNLNDYTSQITLKLGCEIFYSHDCLHLLNEKIIPTMADSRYILVEFFPMADYQYIRNAVQELLFGGYYPILAHIERYHNIIKDMNQVKRLIDMGSYIQVNAMSIEGKAGFSIYRATNALLKNDLVHFVATDAHSEFTRAPKIKQCSKYLTRKFGKSYMQKLLLENPNKILKNEYL